MDEFLEQIEKHRDEFYRYLRRMAWDSGVVDDVFSSAVLTAYQNRHKYTPGSNFRAWMYRILTNKCFVANRETGRTPDNIEDHEYTLQGMWHEPGYDDALEDSDTFLEACGDEVNRAMRVLSTAERGCLLLRVMNGMSYAEVAEVMEIPLGTVMTHLSRGRAKLRKRLLSYAQNNGIVKAPLQVLKRGEDDGKPRVSSAGGAS